MAGNLTTLGKQPADDEVQAVQISNAEIKYALEHNHEFFIQFFMGDKLTFPVPKFHVEIFSLMIDMGVDQFACAIPRDHAKTTLAKLACVWFYLFTPYRFIVYLSNTVSVAVPSTNDIIGFLQCENFESVYGKIRLKTEQEGRGVYKFWLGEKYCILLAFGIGQQVRGLNIDHQRPQLAILDDVDTVSDEVTESSFKKIKRWFFGPFKKALDKAGRKMVQIGNLTETASLIAENCQSRFWHSRVYGCILADGTPLWEDFWSIEKLKQDYQEYLEAGEADVWFAEMMNMPTAGGRGVILADEIVYAPARLESDVKYACITVDLAISDETWAHATVVVVHGWVEEGGVNGQWQSLETKSFVGIDPIQLFWRVMTLVRKWRVQVVGIESVAYQASVKYVWQHECLRNGIEFNEDATPGGRGISFVQLKASSRKTQRIVGWASMIKAKEYALTENDFATTQELIAYRPDKKLNSDDNIDAHAYITQMIDRFLFLIMQEYTAGNQTAIQGSAQLESQG